MQDGQVRFQSPEDGLWSVAIAWADGWPSEWRHAQPTEVKKVGEWTLVSGQVSLPGGVLRLRDAYRLQGPLIQGVRRFEWAGKEPLRRATLSVRWIASGAMGAKPFLPGISHYGNPSGAAHGGRVAIQTMAEGERSFYEEHRYPMPFASIEWAGRGAALHSLPSPVPGGNHADQWWSLGLTPQRQAVELALLSGPCASNGKTSVVKALQAGFMEYPDAWIDLAPGAIIEKTFWLEAYPVVAEGSGFRTPVRTSIDLFQPFALDGLPSFRSIVERKLKFARSRWRPGPEPGFEMYPEFVGGTNFVMGWCGQAEALGYALQSLRTEGLDDAERRAFIQGSLDTLAKAPMDERGFFQRYSPETKKWLEQDFVSQGQAMESTTRAIEAARKGALRLDPTAWEAFMRKACAFHADRILRNDWRPVSTQEGFFVSPLLRASRLFSEPRFATAALKAADHYAARHLSMREPYWGGTLDASCEDKEGAWAGFQAFLAAYDHTGQRRYLDFAEHAMDAALSYTAVWDIDLPPGRLRDHGFKSRGWTVVSAQNQHLDVFGVFYTPEVYRMGVLLGREDLKRLAKVMYRSCGQLIDPFGSQGEQIQQTNFAQHGDMTNVFRLRGGYSEGWTVFWITAFFLHAGARFQEMGVNLDDGVGEITETPAPLYRCPVYDGAADPILVWNPTRRAWWMLYTQRRARLDLPSVEWCHQTKIGIAESTDGGLTWRYLRTAALQAPDEQHSFWAPDVIRDEAGIWHMFVSYIPGHHVDWGGEAHILQYRSNDLEGWEFVGRLPLTSNRCIDASLFRMPNGVWRLWYKDESARSATLAIESRDLKTWTPVSDPGVSRLYGEGCPASMGKGRRSSRTRASIGCSRIRIRGSTCTARPTSSPGHTRGRSSTSPDGGSTTERSASMRTWSSREMRPRFSTSPTPTGRISPRSKAFCRIRPGEVRFRRPGSTSSMASWFAIVTPRFGFV